MAATRRAERLREAKKSQAERYVKLDIPYWRRAISRAKKRRVRQCSDGYRMAYDFASRTNPEYVKALSSLLGPKFKVEILKGVDYYQLFATDYYYIAVSWK